jgi:hypothetical protein
MEGTAATTLGNSFKSSLRERELELLIIRKIFLLCRGLYRSDMSHQLSYPLVYLLTLPSSPMDKLVEYGISDMTNLPFPL